MAEKLNVSGTFTSNIESMLDSILIGSQNVFQPLVTLIAVMSFLQKEAYHGWLACDGQTLSIKNKRFL